MKRTVTLVVIFGLLPLFFFSCPNFFVKDTASYTVSYDLNGASGGTAPLDQTEYRFGDSVQVRVADGLFRTGYSFSGWNTQADGRGISYPEASKFTMGPADVILFARWIPLPSYAISYVPNGATGAPPYDGATYLSGQSLTVPGAGTLVRDGYAFVGWSSKPDGSGSTWVEGQTLTMGDSDLILYARWSNNPVFTLSYDDNGAISGSAPSAVNYEAGWTATVQGNPGSLSKPGFSFSGWNTNPAGDGTNLAPGTNFPMPSSNVILYALWSANPTFSLSYDANGAAGTPPASTSYEAGATVVVLGNVTGMSMAGNTFNGWNSRADGNGTPYGAGSTFAMPASAVILYAQWSSAPSYLLSYAGNGATAGVAPATPTSYLPGTEISVPGNTGTPPLERPGYSFNGWNSASDGTGTVYLAGSTLTMPATVTVLYAQWTTASLYALVYDGNTATGGAIPGAPSYTTSSTVTVMGNAGGLFKTGFSFSGWNDASDGSGVSYAPGDTFLMPAYIVTLYAQWAEVLSYSVNYNANGADSGSVPLDANSYLMGQTVTVLPNNPGPTPAPLVRSGYTFGGWCPDALGNGPSYAAGETFAMPASNVILYARWNLIPKYSLSFVGDGADGGAAPATLAYAAGAVVSLPANTFTRTNYAFANWNSVSNGTPATDVVGSYTMPAAATVLYARWTPVERSVTYVANGGGTDFGGGVYPLGATVTISLPIGLTPPANTVFGGWLLSGTTLVYQPGQTLTMGAETLEFIAVWTPRYSISYAESPAFLLEASGSLPAASTGHSAGAEVLLPNDPLFYQGYTLFGYDFMGWNTAPYPYTGGTAFMANNEYIADLNPVLSMPASNVTLYVWWMPQHMSVNYSNNGGYTVSYPEGQNDYDYESPVTITDNWNLPMATPYFAKQGYGFTGWDLSPSPTPSMPPLYPLANLPTTVPMADLVALASPPPNQGIQLYAQWEANTYSLAYSINPPTPGPTPTGFAPTGGSYKTDQTVWIEPNTGSLDFPGYHLTGWCLNSASGDGPRFSPSGGESFIMPPMSSVLYAMWEQDWYHVQYDPNGSTGGFPPWNNSSYGYGQTMTVADSGSMTRDGYDFAGWTLEPDGDPDASEPIYGPSWVMDISFPEGDLHFYARWVPRSYTVNLDYNGGTGPGFTNPLHAGVGYGFSFVLPPSTDMNNTGWIFNGWCTNAGGYGEVYSPGATFVVRDNVTIYAVWVIVPSYSIVYHENRSANSQSNGPFQAGSTVMVQPISAFGGGFTPPAGKEFMYWSTQDDGSVFDPDIDGKGQTYPENSSITMPYGDLHLYAIWGTRVNYDANGGVGAPPTDSALHENGENVAVYAPPLNFYKNGHLMDGWSTNVDGSGVVCRTGQTFVMGNAPFTAAPLTLYARWKAAEGARTDGTDPGQVTTYFDDAVTDSAGNVYVVGRIWNNGWASFGGKPVQGFIANGDTPLIVKYLPNGDVEWAKSLVSSAGEARFTAVAIDAQSNVYAAGYQLGSGSYDYGDLKTLSAFGGDRNATIVKYNPAGTVMAVRSTNMNPVGAATEFLDLAVSSSGRVIAAGYVGQGNVQFNSMPVNGLFNGPNAILLSFNPDLTVNAAFSPSMVTALETCFNAVAVGPGGIYAAGYQKDGGAIYSVNYAGSTVTGIMPNGSTPVMVRFNESFAGQGYIIPNSVSSSSVYKAIAVDSLGNVHLAGEISGWGTVDFGNGQSLIGWSGTTSQLLVKYSAVGQAQWAVNGKNGSAAMSSFEDIALDAKGNVLVGGTQYTTELFDYDNSPIYDGDGVAVGGPGSGYNLVLVKYDKNGLALWAKAPLSGANSALKGIAVDGSGTPYALGFQDGITTSYGLEVSAVGNGAAFNAVIVKYVP